MLTTEKSTWKEATAMDRKSSFDLYLFVISLNMSKVLQSTDGMYEYFRVSFQVKNIRSIFQYHIR